MKHLVYEFKIGNVQSLLQYKTSNGLIAKCVNYAQQNVAAFNLRLNKSESSKLNYLLNVINNNKIVISTAYIVLHILSIIPSVIGSNNSMVHNGFNDNFINDTIVAYMLCDGEAQSLSALNASMYNTTDPDAALSSVYFKTIVSLLYIAIFIFAVLGNGTVCFIIQSMPRMHTVTNYFIANLAAGDLLMSLFCVPSSFISIFLLGYWPFGIILCYFVNYSQAISVLVTAYTLVAISIDRYIAILWPLRPRITKRYAKLIIIIIWLIALATAFPIPLVSKLVQPGIWHEYCERFVCQEVWPTAEQYYYYTLVLLTLQFILPLTVLIYTYTRIALIVWGERPPGEAENSRDQRMARSKRKMIKMMVTVVIVFTICWLPFNVLILLLNDDEFRLWDPLPYFWLAFHWLAMSHSCYNPIIYCYMNARFRSGFLQIIHRLPGLQYCCCWRRYLRRRSLDHYYEPTGTNNAFHMERVNTCSTYVSSKRKVRNKSIQMNHAVIEETMISR